MNFAAANEFVHALDTRHRESNKHGYAFESGVIRAAHLLARMGGAAQAARRCAIVTGSKGKGSSSVMLANVLAASGLRVGVFTGPHLHTVTERFMTNVDETTPHAERGELFHLMQTTTYARLAMQIAQIVETWDRPQLGTPTRFEAFTAMAYRWFEELGNDFNVIEVGMGGRNDATNLADPVLSLFTHISLEHTQMLGDTVQAIAHEKAGIMRRGRPTLWARQAEPTESGLREAAGLIHALPMRAHDHWQVQLQALALDAQPPGQWVSARRASVWGRISPPDAREHHLLLPLLGEVQLHNLELVLLACDVLHGHGFTSIDMNAVKRGIAATRWPGRFEVLRHAPLTIADGAHTPHSVDALMRTVHAYFPQRRVHVIFGALRDKDVAAMLAALGDACASVRLVTAPSIRAVPAQQLLAWAQAMHPAACACDGLAQALAAVDGLALPNDVVLITGSLYLAAEARKIFPPNAGSGQSPDPAFGT